MTTFVLELEVTEYHVGTKGAICEAWPEGKKQGARRPLGWRGGGTPDEHKAGFQGSQPF